MKTGPALPLTRPGILSRIVCVCRALRDYFRADYDGQGAYATDSRDFTFKAFLGGLVFVAGFVGVFWVLAIAGF